MEKLTKENIYIDLRGKSKEELTDLYNFLESVGEKHFRETLNDFLANIKYFETYIFHKDIWSLAPYVYILNKTKVTIEQLKEILQPMETLKIEDVMIDCTILNNNAIRLIKTIFKTKGHGTRYIRKPFSHGKDIIMADCGNPDHKKLISFAKFKKLFNNQTSLQEQLEKAEAEVKRLKEAIEESKIKVGDWVKSDCNHIMKYYEWMVFSPNWKKITNPQLIELLENEIK